MTYSDETLRAYLDGTLEADRAEKLERDVERDADLEARLIAMEPFLGTVREAFATVPDAQRVQSLSRHIGEATNPKARISRRSILSAGLAAAGVGIGFAVSGLFNRVPVLEWQDEVAIYQALYVPETVEHLTSTSAELAAQFARAGAALGRDLSVADVDGLDGLSLRRAQILSLEGAPLIQIVFSSQDGTPVAFCILERPGDGSNRPVYRERSGLATSHWSDGQFHYMVLGRLDTAALTEITERLRGMV
ncbi:MAG: hypothetical protein AAF376_04670 [Pseudomonadota bacterium]